MPELPEAETIVRGLRPSLVGRTIRSTQVLHEDVLREPKQRFAARVRHSLIRGVDRRGKNVLIRLDDDRLLAVNLGMTGRLLPFQTRPPASRRPAHPAVRFRLDGGGVLVFDDTRRFGTLECLTLAAWAERSSTMGPEPLGRGFTAGVLHAGLRASRAPIRSWLLDQHKIAGVGNIYANEALYLGGIHPQRRARTVTATEAVGLHRGLRKVLRNAIMAGGTTIRDYVTADGEQGRYSRRLLVYGAEGEPCTRCGSRIRRIVFGGRSAFFCPACQPRRRGR